MSGRWTFEAVQDRLVEAAGFMRRMPDRERAWQRGAGTMSLWRQAAATVDVSQVDALGYWSAERDRRPRLPGLTVDEVGRMEEAQGWIDWLPPEDRRIVGLALEQLAGGAARVSWLQMQRRLRLERGRDGLRRRYERGIAKIAERLNLLKSGA